MPPLRAIFFDNDGVLMDTERHYFAATAAALQARGVPFTREDFIELHMRQAKGAWHLLAERGYDAAAIDAARQERNRIYESLLATEPTPCASAHEVVRALRGKYTLAIVTSCHRRHLELMHRRTGLLEQMDFVLALEDQEETKPSPKPYLQALARAGVRREEALVVEDSERGLRAASAAGIRCWIVRTELAAGGDFAGAERLLSSLAELPHRLGPHPLEDIP